MQLKEFGYSLPKELIAFYPLKQRDQARLMIVDRTKRTIRHDLFANVGKYLPPRSTIVLNDSKVMPVRLFGLTDSTQKKVEIFLLRKLKDNRFVALLRPLKRLKDGEKIIFNNNGLAAQVVDFKNRIVQFNQHRISKYLDQIGHMPLPPYIKREDEPSDRNDYQTVYAKKPGSVASPTAGLHFTIPLLKSLSGDGHQLIKVTLHVNYGTFQTVRAEDIRNHRMQAEDYHMTRQSHQTLKQAKEEGRKIVAVGTTSLRVLETVFDNHPLKASTDLFIYPGYAFKMADILITNFHLPYSTLLMLVYAFGSPDLMREAYQIAREEKYRFYSYGDAMIII